MAELRISDLGSLNFNHDWKYPFQTQECYNLKYLTTDIIREQFVISTDTVLPIVRLLNVGTQEITILEPQLVASTPQYLTYNVTISDLAEGCYLFQLFQGEVIDEAAFSIHEELEHSILLSYTNYQNKFETVFVENEPFYFRVEGVFLPQDTEFNIESEDFRDQRYALHLLSGNPYNTYILRFGGEFGSPIYVGNKINRIFACSTVLIDDVEYVKAESASVQKDIFSPAYPLYPFSIQVEKKADGQEIYSFDHAIIITGHMQDFVKSSDLQGVDLSIYLGNLKIAEGISDSTGNVIQKWLIPQQEYNELISNSKTFASGVCNPSGGTGAMTCDDSRMFSNLIATTAIQFATGPTTPVSDEILSTMEIISGGNSFNVTIRGDGGEIQVRFGASFLWAESLEPNTEYFITTDIGQDYFTVYLNGEIVAEYLHGLERYSIDSIVLFGDDEGLDVFKSGTIMSVAYFRFTLPGEVRAMFNDGHPDMYEFPESLLSKCVARLTPSSVVIYDVNRRVERWNSVYDDTLYFTTIGGNALYADTGQNVNWNKIRWFAQKDGYFSEYEETAIPTYQNAVQNGISNSMDLLSEDDFHVSPSSIYIDAIGGDATVSVTSPWPIDECLPLANWLTVSLSGNTITITITTNTSIEGRASSVMISSGVKEMSVLVEQGVSLAYYVDSNRGTHNFTPADTPFANFANSGVNVVINGVTVPKANITELSFGTLYDTYVPAVLPQYFMFGYPSITRLSLPDCSGVTRLGPNNAASQWVFGRLPALAWIDRLDTLLNANVKAVGGACFSELPKLANPLDFSRWTLDYVGGAVLNQMNSCPLFVMPNLSSALSVIPEASFSQFWLIDSPADYLHKTGNTTNITTLGSCLYNWEKITAVDFSESSNIVNLGINALRNCYALERVDFSSLVNLQTVGGTLCFGTNKLATIVVGGLNWNNITVTDDGYLFRGAGTQVPVANRKIYADTQALGDIFKAKFPNLSTYTIVVGRP